MIDIGMLPQLPQPETEAEAAWHERDGLLRAWIARHGYRSFMRCPVVRATMFVGNQPFVQDEYAWLQSLSDWQERWHPATRENWIGAPSASTPDVGTSSQLIHHAHTAAHYEQWRGIPIAAYDAIVEIGGGYGSFARLCHNLGFRGDYVLYDLPAFAALQSWYTAQAGVVAECYYDREAWQRRVATITGYTLFVSLWALSETSARQRQPLLQAIRSIDDFCIAYQGRFREMHNGPAFQEWAATMPEHTWHTEKSFLFGRRRNGMD
jgi:hypothetical protein